MKSVHIKLCNETHAVYCELVKEFNMSATVDEALWENETFVDRATAMGISQPVRRQPGRPRKQEQGVHNDNRGD